ncbi:uncharacterized protein ACNLHF_025363 isoform 2-T2 [Anomaloglossus baeobatrachus]
MMNEAKLDLMEKKRRSQRDRVLRQRRDIPEEQVLMFALGRTDNILPDMDTDATVMVSKQKNLEKRRKMKRQKILTIRRKMEDLVEVHSAASANAEFQGKFLAALKKFGELAPEIRRRNKKAILIKRRNIISMEKEPEEVFKKTPKHFSSRSGSLDTGNLKRAAAQNRIKNKREITALQTPKGEVARLFFMMNEAKLDLMEKKRRAQRDRVLRQRRDIPEEQVLMFALGRTDNILPDMDTDATVMVSKQKNLEKRRKMKRQKILTIRRKMEDLVEVHSAASANAEFQGKFLAALKKFGELAPEIRRRNKKAILIKRRNIISMEKEPEEVFKKTPKHFSSRSGSLDTGNLKRAAAQNRIKNSRDWVVQQKRHLTYAKPCINGNCVLQRSQSPAKTSTEKELEEVFKKTPKHVLPRSGSLETANLKRAAAQNRITNSRDWAVQQKRHLTYAKPRIHGNCVLQRSQSPAQTISMPESKQLSIYPADTALDKDIPERSDKTPSGKDGMKIKVFGDTSDYIDPIRELVITNKPIDIFNLVFQNEIAEGSFGKVILMSDAVTNEQVAVKMMEKTSCSKNNIATEIEILKMAAGCRFTTSLRAFMETTNKYIIVLDFMGGGDLYNHMVESAPFDMETTRLFAAEMLCGLQFLHQNGVIHRDLKPENIFLDYYGHIKIGDFGLSAINVSEEDTLQKFVGSQGYAAPEVMEGERYNHLIDSFSFGVILYMMVVGEKPFDSNGTIEEYYESLIKDVPYFPPGTCPDAIDFIEGLLCRNPFGRYAIQSSIRCHPFFNSINWDDVESGRADPPFIFDYEY